MRLLREAKLSREDIELIWDSVDIGNKEALYREEFCMMMKLIRQRKLGAKINCDTVTDWRLEQLKHRRVPSSKNQVVLPETHKHRNIMKELQPILQKRSKEIEKSSEKDKPIVNPSQQINEIFTQLNLNEKINSSSNELKEIINRLKDLINQHKLTEKNLDQKLMTQRELVSVFNQTNYSSTSYTSEKKSDISSTEILSNVIQEMSLLEQELQDFSRTYLSSSNELQ
jgi:vacuolar-type H+-ATPase subunit I/STV1